MFVGLEAKVDEAFGTNTGDQLENARKQLVYNPRSKAVERIEALPARFSVGIGLKGLLDVRYQLMHGTVGTVSARQANGEPYDYYVFYVLVFRTCLYDERVAEENHQDYRRFISRVGGFAIEHQEHQEVEAHLLTVDAKLLTCIYEHLELPA